MQLTIILNTCIDKFFLSLQPPSLNVEDCVPTFLSDHVKTLVIGLQLIGVCLPVDLLGNFVYMPPVHWHLLDLWRQDDSCIYCHSNELNTWMRLTERSFVTNESFLCKLKRADEMAYISFYRYCPSANLDDM